MTLTKPFDRHSFDPVNDWEDQKYLKMLRSRGAIRRSYYTGRHHVSWGTRYILPNFGWYDLPSLAFFCSMPNIIKDDRPYWHTKGKTFLDLGCGDSADAAFAHREMGMKAYSIDLFPPSIPKPPYTFPYDPEKEEFTFIQSDMVDEIPLEKGSVDAAHCAAVIDLISPEDRTFFYLNVLEVLKPGAKFVITIQKLSRGWGLDAREEANRLLWCGFKIEDKSISNRIVAIKP